MESETLLASPQRRPNRTTVAAQHTDSRDTQRATELVCRHVPSTPRLKNKRKTAENTAEEKAISAPIFQLLPPTLRLAPPNKPRNGHAPPRRDHSAPGLQLFMRTSACCLCRETGLSVMT